MNKAPVLRVERALLVVFVAWLALSIAAPFTVPAGSVTDLSGRASVIDNSAQYEDMNPLAHAVYLFGDLNCHQLADRSFYLNGNQMPYCSRDLGIFAGLAIGMLIVLVISPRFSLKALILLVLPIIVDGTVQLTGWYESNNLLRLATGILGGIGTAYFLGQFAQWTYAGGNIPLLGERKGETGRHGKS